MFSDNDERSIRSKVVAITGASSGIGEATALYLAARGAKVVLGARGEVKLEALAGRITGAGGDAACVSIDVARRADVARLVETARQRFGRLDVLVSAAGVMPIGPLDELAVDDWEAMVDVNVKGVLHGIAAALPVFRAQDVAISSTSPRPRRARRAPTRPSIRRPRRRCWRCRTACGRSLPAPSG